MEKKGKEYVEFDLSNLKDSKGGYLVGDANPSIQQNLKEEWQRRRRIEQAKEYDERLKSKLLCRIS